MTCPPVGAALEPGRLAVGPDGERTQEAHVDLDARERAHGGRQGVGPVDCHEGDVVAVAVLDLDDG